MTTAYQVELALQGYGLKKDGQGYRFNSPFRVGEIDTRGIKC